jgi:acyl-CoA synthetase (AMP-forming)/AMP-acid ligase II
VADAENLIATMGLRRDWPNLGVISLAHSYGFSNLVLPLLLHGVPLILPGGSLPEGVRRAAAAERAVTLPAVPALWRTWFEADAIASSVRLAISAGAPLPLPLEQSVFVRHGLKIHNLYGSTECGGIAYDTTPGPRLDGACAGAAVGNVKLSVAADGCMEVRGPAVGQTYWPEPEPTLSDSVFHTSDLADICFGLVYLRGRACDQINIAGRKVAPEAIEKVLATHPDVRDCLAFGVPCLHGQRGENIVACLVVEREVPEEILRQFLLARMPAWQVPREWWFVESLDANARGKLSRADWRQRYLNRTNAAHANNRSSAGGVMEANL